MNRGEKAAMTRLRNERDSLLEEREQTEEDRHAEKLGIEKNLRSLRISLFSERDEVERLKLSRMMAIKAQSQLEDDVEELRSFVIQSLYPVLGSIELAKTIIMTSFPDFDGWKHHKPMELVEEALEQIRYDVLEAITTSLPNKETEDE